MDSLVAYQVPYVQLYGLMAQRMPPQSPESPQAVGKRLKALRDALEMSQDRISASIGMASGSASWSPYEKGKDLIPAYNAMALCRLYGVTLDFIYRGLWSTIIPFDLADKMRLELTKQSATPGNRRSPSALSRVPKKQARGRKTPLTF